MYLTPTLTNKVLCVIVIVGVIVNDMSSEQAILLSKKQV